MGVPLAGVKVLVVEDNYLIAKLVKEVLVFAGCSVSGPIPRLAEARDVASREAHHVAVLDINLNGERVYPVADILSRRRVPYVFVTGYGDTTLPPEYVERPRIRKPFKREELIGTISNLVQRTSAKPG
jgi:DNA-binding response OmpR family regulator